jgi:mRNA interferase MazF
VNELVTAGQVVLVDFPGVQGTKRRPAVVLSSDAYHQGRPDIIVGLITSNISAATGLTDCILQDWNNAGLRTQSAFRTFLVTLPRTAVIATIGKVSDRDWQNIANCLSKALVH